MIAFLEEKAVAWPSGEPMRRSAAVRHIGDLLGELFTNYQLPTASPLPVEIHTGVETNTSRLSGMSAANGLVTTLSSGLSCQTAVVD